MKLYYKILFAIDAYMYNSLYEAQLVSSKLISMHEKWVIQQNCIHFFNI